MCCAALWQILLPTPHYHCQSTLSLRALNYPFPTIKWEKGLGRATIAVHRRHLHSQGALDLNKVRSREENFEEKDQ